MPTRASRETPTAIIRKRGQARPGGASSEPVRGRPDVFISYSVADLAAATEIRSHLERQHLTCWMAPKDIRGRASWAEQIVSAIEQCGVMLVVVSPGTAQSKHVAREVNLALDCGKPLLPVRIRAVALSGALRYLLELVQHVDVFPGALADHLATVSESVRALLERADKADPTEAVAYKVAPTRPRLKLPSPPTPLVGRERELVELQRLLAGTRVLTLTGPGGTGKTRLALALAKARSSAYRDGVVFVGLAPLSDPALVPSAIASALEVREGAGRSVSESLMEYLADKAILLVLDNFEHLAPAASSISDLLSACPELSVLVTSRASLHLRGEQEFSCPPLTTPELGDHSTEQLMATESVRLFCARAQQVDPQFRLTADNADAVATICRALDGLPLALELAAPRLKILSTGELIKRLERRLPLLTEGAADAPARHKTLTTTIAWSYDLLSDPERALFRRFSVFAGGATFNAVHEVCNGDLKDDLLSLIGSLVDKSLLRARTEHGEPRFRVLQVLREFGVDQLAASGEQDEFRRRHAEYFTKVLEVAEPELLQANQAMWLERLDAESDNVRSALAYALEKRSTALGIRLASASRRFWEFRGRLAEGRAWLEQVLTMTPSASAELDAKVLNAAGSLAWHQGDYDAAEPWFGAALDLRRKQGDLKAIAGSLSNLGIIAWERGDYDRARGLLEESLLVHREAGNKWGMAASLGNLGDLAQYQLDLERSSALFNEALVLFRELEDLRSVAMALQNAGITAIHLGDLEAAERTLREGLALSEQVGDAGGIAGAEMNLGQVATRRGDYTRARTLLARAAGRFLAVGELISVAQCAERMGEVLGEEEHSREAIRLWSGAAKIRSHRHSVMHPADHTWYDPALQRCRTVMEPLDFEAAWNEGQALSASELVEAAQAHPSAGTPQRR
jgi:predicted ATPase/Tfp pilus assembly protein PilF